MHVPGIRDGGNIVQTWGDIVPNDVLETKHATFGSWAEVYRQLSESADLEIARRRRISRRTTYDDIPRGTPGWGSYARQSGNDAALFAPATLIRDRSQDRVEPTSPTPPDRAQLREEPDPEAQPEEVRQPDPNTTSCKLRNEATTYIAWTVYTWQVNSIQTCIYF